MDSIRRCSWPASRSFDPRFIGGQRLAFTVARILTLDVRRGSPRGPTAPEIPMRTLLLSAVALAALAFFFLRSAADGPSTVTAATLERAPSAATTPLESASFESWQDELLALAFEAAVRVPAYPHLKTRSELQERVFVAALELDQPALAERYAARMEGWRRGSAFADLAFYRVQHGPQGEVERLIELARAEVTRLDLQEKAEEEGFDGDDEAVEIFQSWRRDRIRAKLARTLLALGQEERAIEFETLLEPSERGTVELERARRMSSEEAGRTLARLGDIVQAGTLEDIRNGLQVATVLAARFHADPERGPEVRSALEAALVKGPAMFRADMTIALAERLVEQGEHDWSHALVRSAVARLEELPIALEDDLPLRARAVELRHAVGDPDARKALDALLGRFDSARETIPEMTHADLLVPLAEAYVALGERAAALRLYHRAAVQGALNVNAVPRTDDLVRVSTSLAIHGVEPDSELRALLERTLAGLTEPW